MQKQYDKKHKIQRLYIHWDVSTQCQLKCSYCYAIDQYGLDSDWGKIDSWTRQQLVIRNIHNSTLPVFLGLLGGEPTIHPNYTNLIDLCHKAISTHPDGRLYVTTNGLQSNDFFRDHKFYPNMYFLWSIHFEYISDKNIENIYSNIQTCIDKGFRNKVNVMLHPNEKYWPKIHSIIDRLETMNVEIHPHFLYNGGDVHDVYPYPDHFFNEFSRFKDYDEYLIFESNDSISSFNDYTIFKNKQTCFKDWNCWNNNYEIDAFGNVCQFCFDEHDSLISNFNYFKNISKIKPRLCPHNSCNCDGLLKINKEKL
jgi:MoaA/NifB/PqqE/SkfB family radical SAM enzyme